MSCAIVVLIHLHLLFGGGDVLGVDGSVRYKLLASVGMENGDGDGWHVRVGGGEGAIDADQLGRLEVLLQAVGRLVEQLTPIVNDDGQSRGGGGAWRDADGKLWCGQHLFLQT